MRAFSRGAVAQLGERLDRTQEVVSSNLIGSTISLLHYVKSTSAPFRYGVD